MGETYFVVMKYDMTGDKGITSIWVNPSSTTEPIPNHTTDAGGGKTTKKQPQIASLSLRQTKNKMASVDIDEIFVTFIRNETYAVVVTGVVKDKFTLLLPLSLLKGKDTFPPSTGSLPKVRLPSLATKTSPILEFTQPLSANL